ncbi:MAG TPA: SH3 domain-containing protein [Vicinamibacteria bacterium]|nr:SH3 domain-containing protein [Vicinamibacteria bacterium]
MIPRILGRLAGLAAIALVVASCGARTASMSAPTPPPPPPEPAPESSSSSSEAAPVESPRENGDSGALTTALGEASRLREALAERSAEVTALEEAKATLELELKSALEELVRSQTSVRNVQSRAFAVSRIAEVRVELQLLRRRKDPAVTDRLDRAAGFIEHADRALESDNVGGAAYLAERASELLRQVRTIAEIRSDAPTELIPIVPPRTLQVVATANLRKAPTSDSEKLGAVEPGTELRAIARRGDWFQVELEAKDPVWVHRRLVR